MLAEEGARRFGEETIGGADEDTGADEGADAPGDADEGDEGLPRASRRCDGDADAAGDAGHARLPRPDPTIPPTGSRPRGCLGVSRRRRRTVSDGARWFSQTRVRVRILGLVRTPREDGAASSRARGRHRRGARGGYARTRRRRRRLTRRERGGGSRRRRRRRERRERRRLERKRERRNLRIFSYGAEEDRSSRGAGGRFGVDARVGVGVLRRRRLGRGDAPLASDEGRLHGRVQSDGSRRRGRRGVRRARARGCARARSPPCRTRTTSSARRSRRGFVFCSNIAARRATRFASPRTPSRRYRTRATRAVRKSRGSIGESTRHVTCEAVWSTASSGDGGDSAAASATFSFTPSAMSETERQLACLHADALAARYRLALAVGNATLRERADRRVTAVHRSVARRAAESTIYGATSAFDRRRDAERLARAETTPPNPADAEASLAVVAGDNPWERAVLYTSMAALRPEREDRAALLERAAAAILEGEEDERKRLEDAPAPPRSFTADTAGSPRSTLDEGASTDASRRSPIDEKGRLDPDPPLSPPKNARTLVPASPSILSVSSTEISIVPPDLTRLRSPVRGRPPPRAATFAVFCKPLGSGVAPGAHNAEFPNCGVKFPANGTPFVTVERSDPERGVRVRRRGVRRGRRTSRRRRGRAHARRRRRAVHPDDDVVVQPRGGGVAARVRPRGASRGRDGVPSIRRDETRGHAVGRAPDVDAKTSRRRRRRRGFADIACGVSRDVRRRRGGARDAKKNRREERSGHRAQPRALGTRLRRDVSPRRRETTRTRGGARVSRR